VIEQSIAFRVWCDPLSY